MKTLVLLLILLLLSACQPPPVVVITATTPSTFPTVDVRPTDTLTAPPAATVTAEPVTPTAEVYAPHAGCVALQADYFDDPISGCVVNRNAFLNRDFVTQDGVDVPRYWVLGRHDLPVSCVANRCEVALSQNAIPQGETSYRQTLSEIENGQCYLAKALLTFRIQGTLADWPESILFVSMNDNKQSLARGLNNPNPGDANFIRGTTANVWPLRGTDNPTPVLEFGIARQWAVVRAGSYVAINGLFLFAAPESFCEGGALPLS